MNKIDRDKLMAIIEAKGLSTVRQSAFTRCEMKPSLGKIYIANAKKVGRVDMSGFTLNCPGVISYTKNGAKEMGLGKVRAQLDFNQSEEVVLRALADACEVLKATTLNNTEALTVEKRDTGDAPSPLEPLISKDIRKAKIREAAARAAAHAER